MKTRILKKNDWQDVIPKDDYSIIGKRTVAFIDILGFRNLIKEKSLIDLATAYEDVVDQILRTNLPSEISTRPNLFPDHPLDLPYCKTFIFSDSIIIISNGPSQNETLKTLILAWRTLQQLLVHGLTARGAITHGEIYINSTKNIFLGSALTNCKLPQK